MAYLVLSLSPHVSSCSNVTHLTPRHTTPIIAPAPSSTRLAWEHGRRGVWPEPQVLLALERGVLVLLRIQQGALTEEARVTLDSEISCLDVSPMGARPPPPPPT